MAANTSKYLYLVGLQEFAGSEPSEPWVVQLLTPSLDDAKAHVRALAGRDDVKIINFDTKRNNYWHTLRLKVPDGSREFMVDIQKVKVSA